MDDILSGLNERQIEAVTTTEGYLRVIAGAGSGKTRLLVSRYAYLVREYGIAPSNILCVTFTNKAAGEMKRRVRAAIGGEYDTSLISTYHGFCVRVLREDIEKVFYPKEFTIIDEVGQKSILGEIYRKFELKLDHASFEKILDMIAEYKAKNRSYVARMCARDNRPITDGAADLNSRIIEEYLGTQRRRYAMDFSDLLYFTLDIFARCPDVLEKWQDRLNYIQVDEFQDSSRTEMELVDLLSAKYKNLMIVGDPDQNIYEWRGSDVRLLVDFDKTHVPTKTVILDRNYRSTPEILRCANTLIEKNVFRLKKDLYTENGGGAPVIHYHEKSEFAEAGRIVENIHALRRELGLGYGSFAVLYRSGFLSRVIEKKLTESGIPYEIFGGVKFYRRMEIQDILAYLRLVAAKEQPPQEKTGQLLLEDMERSLQEESAERAPTEDTIPSLASPNSQQSTDENAAFRRIINTPRRRFGRTRLERLIALADGGSLYETLRRNLDDPAFAGSGAADFVALIDSLREFYPTARISETVERVCAGSGYEQYIRELGNMERFDNLSEFKRIAGEYEQNFGEDLTLPEFIAQLDIMAADSDDGGGGSDTVKLMTIHAAKGLEFPVVFVPGFSEGIFPSAKTVEERRLLGIEEERRLCYVAITRAERRLFLLDSEGTTGGGRTKTPSRFLFEIGEENYTRIGVIPKELRDGTTRIVSGQPAETGSLAPGSAVSHPAFGDGVVESYNVKKHSYRVRFEKLGGTRDIAEDFFRRPRRGGDAPAQAKTEAAGAEEQSAVGAHTQAESSAAASSASADGVELAKGEIAASSFGSRDESINSPAEGVRRALLAVEEASRRAAAEADAAREARAAAASRDAESRRRIEAELKAIAEARRAALAFTDDDSISAARAVTAADGDSDASIFGEQQSISFDLPEGGASPFGSRAPATDIDFDLLGDELDDMPLADEEDEIFVAALRDETETEFIPMIEAPKKHISTSEYSNLWDDPTVPKEGWVCVGVSDLGEPSAVCEMCGRQIIRYVHHMRHPRYRPLGVGCVCAGKMEGDPEGARARERDFKRRESRKKTFLARKWKVSRNGNRYLKIREHIIVLIEERSRGGWRYSFDGTFCRETFATQEGAILAVFEELEVAGS